MNTDYIVKISGKTVLRELVMEATVNQQLLAPAVATITTMDDPKVLGLAGTKLGDAVEIEAVEGGRIFKGTLVSMGAEQSAVGQFRTWRAYDDLHKLTSGTRSAVYLSQKVSDVIKKVISTHGVSCTVRTTSRVHDHLWQFNESDYDFILRLATGAGFTVLVDDGKIVVDKPKKVTKDAHAHSSDGPADPDEATADYNVLSWQAWTSSSDSVSEVTVTGWDPSAKKAVRTALKTKSAQIRPDAPPVTTKSTIQVIGAQTVADSNERAETLTRSLAASHTDLRLRMLGSPEVAAGRTMGFGAVGKPFDGSYLVTHVRHEFGDTGYISVVEASRDSDRTLHAAFTRATSGRGAGQADGGADGQGAMPRVAPAIVTNTKDPNNQGRVKVKFPWLDEKLESWWIRCLSPGAGKKRGIIALPQVNDEVLVLLGGGPSQEMFVVGGLHNGKDTPPTPGHVNGLAGEQVWQSVSGHKITLDDSKGKEKISIATADGGATVVLDQIKKAMTVKAAAWKINVEGMDVTLKGTNVTIEATGNLKLKGAIGTLESSGALTVKGAIVKIN